jgi:hypothetical protein
VTQIPPEQHMRLFLALPECDDQLRRWARASETNSRLVDEDPAAALEAAGLPLDRDVMVEFEAVLRDLAQKLELGDT